MNTSQMDSKARPRVLIVEPDPELAMALIREGLSLGLEPKLCRGPVVSLDCPGLRGEPCARTERIAATLITIVNEWEGRAAPTCAGQGSILVRSPTRRGSAEETVGGVRADRRLIYPFDPREAAHVLLELAGKDECEENER